MVGAPFLRTFRRCCAGVGNCLLAGQRKRRREGVLP